MLRRYVLPFGSLLAALLLGVTAGAASSTESRDPSDAAAATVPFEYRSVFADYQSLADAERKPWRAANEEVTGQGGHAGHGAPRTPQAPEAAPDPQQPPVKRDDSDAHRGH